MATKRQKRKEQKPEDSSIKRTLARTLCGWCTTEQHDSCMKELLWYEKHYVCSCACADDFYKTLDSTPAN